jgi:hypothetical protein
VALVCESSTQYVQQLLSGVTATVLCWCSGQAILLDVRLGNKYEASHAAASLSTPLYLPIQNWDLASNIRRAGFAFFGIYGTGAERRWCQGLRPYWALQHYVCHAWPAVPHEPLAPLWVAWLC